MKKLLTFLTLLTLSIGVTWAATTTTVLSLATTGVTGNSYTNWTQTVDGVTFSGNSMKSGSGYLQLRAKDNSGIVSTNSIGTIKKVAVIWGTGNSNGKALDIYGKNSAYSAPGDLYDPSIQGTQLGSIVYGAESAELTVEGSYAYIGLKSNNGAIYIDQITITWETGGSTVETVATPTFNPAAGTYTEAQNVTISCTTAGATIHYTTDGSTPTTTSPTYSSAIPVSSTTTIKAIAVKSGMNNSDVASATYTINIPQPSGSNRFERIKNTSDLEPGKRYLFVYEAQTPAVMGATTTSSTHYGQSVTTGFTFSNGVITLEDGTDAKPLTLGGESGAWTFDLDGSLIGWSSGNSLSSTTNSRTTTWTISFNGNNAVITNTAASDRVIKYNTGSPRFACYTSGQQPIQLYKEVVSTTTTPLYLIGENMNSQSGWNLTTGPEFTYSTTAKTYSVDAYFDMADRCFFQFVEGLSDSNSNWGGLSGRYYASSYDSSIAVDTYDMDGTVPLYFTNSTQYSPGEYSFSVPAGLYTIVVDKPNWKIYVTQHPVTMTINNNTSGTTYFEDSATATLVSNLTAYDGAKIYYTIDGSDPTNSSTRQEYTAPIPISSNTTVKAIAELNHIKSEVAERTFTMKPKAPTFNPESGYLHETTQVEISCATPNTVIYYTTNGDTPDNTSTLYEGPITVSETTTIKAIAYLGDVYGSVASATYTFTGDIVPGENDFILVTNENQLKAGVEYIIVNQVNKKALSTTQNTANRSAVNVTLSGDNMLATLNDNIQVITLLGDENGWYLYTNATENYPNGGYLYATGSTSRNELKTSEEMKDGAMALISIAANAKATIAFQVPKTDYNNDPIIEPWYLRYNTSSNGLFSCYGGPSNQLDVYLYYRGDVTPPTPTEATLADLCSTGEPGKTYTIKNEDGLLGVYKDGTSIWFKDEGQLSIDKQTPGANDKDYAIVLPGPNNTSTTTYQKNFDQSNWIEVVCPEGVDYTNSYVKNLTGRLESKANPKLTLTVTPVAEDIQTLLPSAQAYVPNPYIAANFEGSQPGTVQGETFTYFFSKPKVQEYAQILWAVYKGNNEFEMPEENNAYGFTGSFKINGSMNATSLEGLQNGYGYDFKAIIRKEAAEGSKAVGDYVVYPLDLRADVPTAIDNIFNINSVVKSVKYVNVAGMVSDVPFQGVNIVVTEYTDGSRTTSKMLRK